MSAPEKEKLPDFSAARLNMVDSQLRPNKVTDRRILDAMETLPRERFVPPALAGIAYKDEDLQIAPGRFLMEPMILGRLLQEAAIKATDKVLDIAPASGYSTAVIAALAKEVTGVESDPSLITQAVGNLAALEIRNAEMQLGPLKDGWTHKAPYDVILINGSVDAVPDALFAQLAEGGRLMAVIRQWGPAQAAHISEARLHEKIHGAISHRGLFDANIKPLPGFQAPAKFHFA
jgi:protein-L-isoaspartate(D-aspartate) O-methyltransferase